MIKNISKLEVKIGERIYQLICDIDSPLGELHDALSNMKGYVINVMQEIEKTIKEDDKEE